MYRDGVRGAVIQRDYPIAGIDGSRIFCDLYGLENRRADRPAVVFVHGGGFVGGDKDQFLAASAYLALAADALCVTVQYRTAEVEPYPAPVIDLFGVFGWLQEHWRDLGICLEKICVAGGSPGANIGAMAMLADSGWKKRYGIDLKIFQPVNGIFLNGIYDMEAFYRQNPQERRRVEQYLGLDLGDFGRAAKTERLREGSPIRMGRAGCRLLLLHGSEDRVIPPEQCWEMEAAMRRAGSWTKTVMFPGEGHAWFNSQEKWYPVIEQMELFLRKLEYGREPDGVSKTDRIVS